MSFFITLRYVRRGDSIRRIVFDVINATQWWGYHCARNLRKRCQSGSASDVKHLINTILATMSPIEMKSTNGSTQSTKLVYAVHEPRSRLEITQNS